MKIDWLRSRPDLANDAGRRLLQGLSDAGMVTEATDGILPWIVREWRAGRIEQSASRPDVFLRLDPEDGIAGRLEAGVVTRWGEWFRSRDPGRVGVDVMSLDVDEVIARVASWNDRLSDRAGAPPPGEVVHRFDDGWTIQRLSSTEELVAEGIAMRNCLAEGAHGGETLHSLRDRDGRPHLTLRVDLESVATLRRMYGRANSWPKPEYAERIAEWLADREVRMCEQMYFLEDEAEMLDFEAHPWTRRLPRPTSAVSWYGLVDAAVSDGRSDLDGLWETARRRGEQDDMRRSVEDLAGRVDERRAILVEFLKSRSSDDLEAVRRSPRRGARPRSPAHQAIGW